MTENQFWMSMQKEYDIKVKKYNVLLPISKEKKAYSYILQGILNGKKYLIKVLVRDNIFIEVFLGKKQINFFNSATTFDAINSNSILPEKIKNLLYDIFNFEQYLR